jgi:hypothetical protein
MNIKLQFEVERRLGDPNISIIIDDNMPVYNGPCQDYYDLNVSVIPGSHDLRITHYGKTVNDHVYDDDGKVVIDKHVKIKSISFDDVELNKELWDGEFYPVYNPDYINDCAKNNIDVPYSLTPNLYLGHNGMWTLKFDFPSTDWLIKIRNNKILKVSDPDFLTGEQDLNIAKAYFDIAPDLPWDRSV